MVRFPKIKPAPKYQSTAPRVRENVGELPVLRGTEKQVAYANEIRDALLDRALAYYFGYDGEPEKIAAARSGDGLYPGYLHYVVGYAWEAPRDLFSGVERNRCPEKISRQTIVENLPSALRAFVERHRNAEYWIENNHWSSDALGYENDFCFDFLVYFIALYVQTER